MPARRPSSSPAGRPSPRPGARGGAVRPSSGGKATTAARGSAKRPAAPTPRVTANGSVPASKRGGGARAILNRPAGPAREQRRRSHYGLVLPEVVTVRLLVLGVVLLIATVLLVPTVRAAVQQSMELHQLESTLAQRHTEAEALQRELARWDDPAYVEGQARDRLQYVMPGDHVWRTIGGDDIVEDIDPLTGKPVEDGVVGTLTSDGTPWYAAIWTSVQTADGPPADEAHPGTDPTEGDAGSPVEEGPGSERSGGRGGSVDDDAPAGDASSPPSG